MKKALQFLAIFLVASLYAQQISEYQYILVPQKFKDEKSNRFDLNMVLTSKLKQKKFVVFNENLEQQPESISNSCEILKAEISDVSNFLTNKTRITFTDCKGKTVATFDGKSSIKDFEPGMQEALANALKTMTPSTQTKKVISTENVETSNIAEIKTPQKEIKKVTSENKNVETKNSEKAEVYTNGNLTLNKIILGSGEFILVNPNSSIPFATFKPSSKKDTFRVQLQDGSSTLGYVENEKIIVEIANSDGTFSNQVFEKK